MLKRDSDGPRNKAAHRKIATIHDGGFRVSEAQVSGLIAREGVENAADIMQLASDALAAQQKH